MTMVRGGEERDLAAIVAMGRARAEPCRFHLDRDVDFVQYAITSKRLLAQGSGRRTRANCISSSRKRESPPPLT
jgi:hypothetical protein